MYGGSNANVQDVKVFRAAARDSWESGAASGRVHTHTLEGVGVMPRTTSDSNNGDGFQGRSIVGKSLFVDDDADVEKDDEFELADARGRTSRWMVDGDVDIDYANPFSTWSPGREIQIKKVGGK